jgi:hypothetical protein
VSQRALALAVRDTLRSSFGWSAEECDVQPPPGKPPAVAGEFYCAVWENGFDNKAFDSRDDRHRISVTLTRRVTYSPQDREAEEVIHRLVVGMEVMADQVSARVHADLQGAGRSAATNYGTLDAANDYILEAAKGANANVTVYGFCEPLRFLSQTRTEEKNGDWFWGDPAEKGVGRALTISFGEARRVQSVFLQE